MTVQKNKPLKLAKAYFYLAIFALAVGGLFSLPPVALRKSNFADPELIERIFGIALVIHVDLSVLVWFLAIMAMVWLLVLGQKKILYFNEAAAFLGFAGTMLIALSAFTGGGEPLKNNYIPVITNDIFLIGLAFFICGIIIQAGLGLLQFGFLQKKLNKEWAREFGAYTSALIILVAFLHLPLTHANLNAAKYGAPEQYYEILFWATGHTLQIGFTQMLILCWLWLADIARFKLPFKSKHIAALYFIGVMLTLPPLLIYAGYSPESPEFYNFFTWKMKYCSGIATAIVGLVILYNVKLQLKTINNCLLFSIIVFGLGGILGFLATKGDTTVPAHYHGSIVGITLAFMGVVYHMLPKFGFGDAAKLKAAIWQPVIYGGGQLMHITGLAVMGGYGALRKSAGSSAEIDTMLGKILFFTGGSLAIIGGFMFVVLVLQAVINRQRTRKLI